MNRTNAIIIRNNNQELHAWLDSQGITYERSIPCPQLNEDVFFIQSLTDIQMIEVLDNDPDFYEGLIFKSNYKLWHDNGEQEIIVRDNEYKDYNINQLYVNRKGTYDVIEEI